MKIPLGLSFEMHYVFEKKLNSCVLPLKPVAFNLLLEPPTSLEDQIFYTYILCLQPAYLFQKSTTEHDILDHMTSLFTAYSFSNHCTDAQSSKLMLPMKPYQILIY